MRLGSIFRMRNTEIARELIDVRCSAKRHNSWLMNDEERPVGSEEASAAAAGVSARGRQARSQQTKRLHRSKSYDNKRRRVHDIGSAYRRPPRLTERRLVGMDGWMDEVVRRQCIAVH